MNDRISMSHNLSLRHFDILIFWYFSPSSIECVTLKLITMSTDLLFVGTTLSSAQWRRKAQNMAPRSPDLQAHIQSIYPVRSFDLHTGHWTVRYSLNHDSVLKLDFTWWSYKPVKPVLGVARTDPQYIDVQGQLYTDVLGQIWRFLCIGFNIFDKNKLVQLYH